jgi:hypothetical protein
MNIKLKKIEELLDNVFSAQAFLVSYSLGIFNILNNKSMTLEDLCQELALLKRPLQALLSLCSSLGLLKVIGNKYYLTENAKNNLVAGRANYYGEVLNLLIKNNEIFDFKTIKAAVLNNESQIYHGNALFEENSKNHSLVEDFTKSMHNKSYLSAKAFVEHLDFSKNKIFLDIGGGSGVYTINACKRWSNLMGIVFDIPLVCKISQRFIDQDNMNKQIKTCSGDMWKDDFPEADIHFYSDILHDWPDAKNLFLLRKSYDNLPIGGQIILNEKLFNNNKTGPLPVSVYNLKMLLWTEGQQYSYKDISKILKSVGFQQVKHKKYLNEWSIVSAIK